MKKPPYTKNKNPQIYKTDPFKKCFAPAPANPDIPGRRPLEHTYREACPPEFKSGIDMHTGKPCTEANRSFDEHPPIGKPLGDKDD